VTYRCDVPRRHLPAVGTIVVALVIGACTAGGTDPPSDLTLGPLAARGVDVARDRGCGGCHSSDGKAGSGPTWRGLWGSEVRLGSGDTVTADRVYLRRSITDPRAMVVDGFANIMPVYSDLSDADVDALVAYICMLGDDPAVASCEDANG
jgi:cytochrome c1